MSNTVKYFKPVILRKSLVTFPNTFDQNMACMLPLCHKILTENGNKSTKDKFIQMPNLKLSKLNDELSGFNVYGF